jgi:hypothetical protein
MGGRYPIRQLSLQPEASGAFATGNGLRAKHSGAKGRCKAISEHAGHNMSERRASLENPNVTAELVISMRRLKLPWEASDDRTTAEHRGNGDGMSAKETRVNTGSPERRGARPQPDAREGEAGPIWMAERPVGAMKRLITVERRGLSSRSAQPRARVRRLT